jgi:hypothetical protein
VVRPGVPLSRRLLAHELCHVLQAERHAWPFAYVWQWMQYGFSYYRMPFEVEAREAERDDAFLAWADSVLAGLRVS